MQKETSKNGLKYIDIEYTGEKTKQMARIYTQADLQTEVRTRKEITRENFKCATKKRHSGCRVQAAKEGGGPCSQPGLRHSLVGRPVHTRGGGQ